MHTDSGMTGISLSGYMPYMTVASLEMSDEPTLYDKALHGTRAKYVRSLLKYQGYITAQPVSRTVHCSELLRSLI